MVRCKKCNKRFDEEMYSHICPKCGLYNRLADKYDINQYFSTNDGGNWEPYVEPKVSTQNVADRSHERLHRMYEKKTVSQAHQKHHGEYSLQKKNSTSRNKQYMFYLWAVFFLVIVIIITSVICKTTYFVAKDTYLELSYTEKKVEQGEEFDIAGRGVKITSVECCDTELIGGIPEGKTLAVMYFDVDTRDMGWDNLDVSVYFFDGKTYSVPISQHTIESALVILGIDVDDFSNYYSFLNRDKEHGCFIFVIDEDACEYQVVFDEYTDKNKISVLSDRVTVYGNLMRRDHQ